MEKIHLMGVLGSGLSGIASLALKMGYDVSGCDLKKSGHDLNHIKDIDLLVVSPAILYQNNKHPELIEGINRGIVLTWQEFLGQRLMKNKKVIAIAGTHGKSTTTAMVAKILCDSGYDPSVVIGAYVPEWGGNSRFGNGEFFVVEADEFNNNFLNYHPDIAVINNIEFDHPDFFKSEQEVFESFEKFKRNLVGEKILFTQDDSENLKFNLKLFGEHNQKNANMAFLVGKHLGIDKQSIIKSLENFNGIGRRMELLGEAGGIMVYDDYAHHPTAIRETLNGLRMKYPLNRIWAVVEAHGFNRTSKLIDLYKKAFESADKVLVGPIFKARDQETFGMDQSMIVKVSEHKDIRDAVNVDDIIKTVQNDSKSGDIIIVMGAGNSNLWAKQILQALKN